MRDFSIVFTVRKFTCPAIAGGRLRMDKLTLITIKTVAVRTVIATQHGPRRSVTSRRIRMIHYWKIVAFWRINLLLNHRK